MQLATTDLVTLSTPSSALFLLDDIRHDLAECYDLADVQNLRDKAEAVRHYLKSAAMGLEALNRAAVVKLLCEHRAGTILKQLVRHGGDRRPNRLLPRSQLDEFGIKNKMQSSRLQLLASVSEEEFWRFVNQLMHEEKEVTTQALLRFARLHRRNERAVMPSESDRASLAIGLKNLARQGKQFCCIYACPAWCGGRTARTARLAKGLFELPVKAVAAGNAHAHLAVRPELIKEGIAILEKWGFRFRGELVRRALAPEFGNYWQPAHVSLLLGVRGRLPFRDTGLPSWLDDHDFFGNGNATEIHAPIARVSPPPYLDLMAEKTVRDWISPRSFA
jgi:hypothetical protein